ncbi:2-amino-4-hydroxy-6-hydroxymethyldihydropteridine diphosphokinase [Shewanella surugensis]|uniref:2-amino-4-hydroxy-6-hydroxymethyldihydropteridine diphosphokinase n=1 Tax=Shewanella surugensis TaxID=212020 RepID=A0ABT0L645_9GAMM|nr:2-amino-4-hydroxy-6-hydroxymethyldihydropteridine diphosphokinase [Shewanella surugensis]MCL1123154.1 2-amino-4-hydroxy-6-hydroxymethyldihydropteridine diphosphokinase [Shewanella surugensis]
MATIYISIGSNIEPEQYLKAALVDLEREFGVLDLSSVFESEAIGFQGNNFLNMVVSAQTLLSIEAVVAIFKQIEKEHGRLPGVKKFSARTLDLDLLLYDDQVCQQPIALPRDEIVKNAFVLWPLAEIAPLVEHPIAKQTYAVLWDAYDKQTQRLWPVDFQWQSER